MFWRCGSALGWWVGVSVFWIGAEFVVDAGLVGWCFGGVDWRWVCCDGAGLVWWCCGGVGFGVVVVRKRNGKICNGNIKLT